MNRNTLLCIFLYILFQLYNFIDNVFILHNYPLKIFNCLNNFIAFKNDNNTIAAA